MPTFRLKRKQPLEPNAEVDILHGDDRADSTVELVEFEPGKNKKYLVSVEVGDLPPAEAMHYLKNAITTLKEFFGNNVMVIPARNGHPSMAVYEVEEVPDAPGTV
jgi:hypothetical protein